MRVTITSGLTALGMSLALAGCTSLTGDKLIDNPNRPTVATAATLLGAAQPNLYLYLEGHGGRVVCIWVQQCAGTSKQYQVLGNYSVGANEWTTTWAGAYGKGGLIDLRKLQSLALASGDSATAGIGAILEAWLIGTTADLFGDIPYRDAAGGDPTPTFDPQQQVYADLQQKLDDAITDLNSSDPLSTGPGDVDLVYGGNSAKWLGLAYTLKARLFLHTAEVVGTAAYDSALASALNGISAPADDYNAYHSLVQSENNLWYQFTAAWVDYLSAGQALVDLMSARADSVLRPQYFNLNSADEYRGALPGDVFVDTISTLSDARLAPDFQQPLVTWAENQLIIAEAAYQTGDEPTAQTALVAVRTNAGVTNPDYSGSPPTGAALLSEIMLEKYVALFQSPESWNDYKRTCLPALVPANGISLPGRYKYPTDESDNNPNTPADPQRNWNDPNPC